MRSLICLCLLVLLMPIQALASSKAVSNLSSAEIVSDVEAIVPGEPFWVALHLSPQPGWHSYWRNAGDSGLPTRIDLTLPAGFAAGEIHWPAPERIIIGTLGNYGYEKDVYLLIPVTPPASFDQESVTVVMQANWLLCKEICVPEQAQLSLTLPVSGDAMPKLNVNAETFRQVIDSLPMPLAGNAGYARDGKELLLSFPLDEHWKAQKITFAHFYPYENDILNNAADQALTVNGDRLQLRVAAGEGEPVADYKGVLSITPSDDAKTIHSFETVLKLGALPADGGNASDMSLWLALIFALLGGLILNIMPCVLPILSLKALGLAQQAHEAPGKARAHGYAYTAGVILSFTAIAALLIFLQSVAKQAVGWGFHLQSPAFVFSLAALFVLIGLNLLGLFEIPVLFGNAGNKLTSQSGAKGSFFAGMLAVMVASPCTAPFMAPALGYALTQPPFAALLIFQALGLGFALPYLLLAMSPKLLRWLPKPGAWILNFKKILALPMLLTALWLIWVGVQQISAPAQQAVMLKQDAVPFSQEALDKLRHDKAPVFVNATADWCITCKVNERVALSSARLHQAFADKRITYMVADWTKQNAEISEFLKQFQRQGVPLYVYYPPQGEPVVLPQLLLESTVLEAISR